MVYVLNKDGQPLMPTEKHGYVRRLLKAGRAKVVSVKPFTIRLLYETGNHVKPLILGIDPGRTNIGLAVVKEDGTPVFQAECRTRNKEIPKLMAKRKIYRQKHRHYGRRGPRIRRAKANSTVLKNGEIKRHLPGYGEEKTVTCKTIRNKEARFSNRKRPAGWLTPTARQLLETHVNLIKRVQKFLPVTRAVLELNRFAFMAMDNPKIQKWQYQKGPLYGYGGVKEALIAMQDGKCLLCRKAEITQIHHLVPQHKGGSDTLANQAGLCDGCHAAAHTDSDAQVRLERKKAGQNKKYHALSVLNQIVPALVEQLSKIVSTCVTTGRDTAQFRKGHDLPKEHWIDACCIACSALPKVKPVENRLPVHKIWQFRRHDRQACEREMSNRTYVQDEKTVCKNRHKTFEQGSDSLEEYKEAGGRTDLLAVKRVRPVYKDMHRIMPGAQTMEHGQVKTLLKRSSGYYWFDDGNRYSVKKTRVTVQNKGLVFV